MRLDVSDIRRQVWGKEQSLKTIDDDGLGMDGQVRVYEDESILTAQSLFISNSRYSSRFCCLALSIVIEANVINIAPKLFAC